MPEETILLDGERFNPYGRFYNAWVPTQLLQSVEISDGAKLAYGLLRKFAGKDGACFPLQSTLARQLGCKTRTAHKYINELKRAGLISVKRRGRGRSLSYAFLWKKELNSGQLFMPGSQEDASLTRTNVQDVSGSGSGSLYRNSSSRACGNVENFDSAPESATIEGNQTQVGTSEQPAGEQCVEVLECGGNAGRSGNEDVLGGKLARNGWEVVRLGNQTTKDTDVTGGLLLRNSIRELAWSKRMDKRR